MSFQDLSHPGNRRVQAEVAAPNGPGEKLLAAGIHLRRGETALAALTLAEDGTSVRLGNRGCLVLTDQRLFHKSGTGDDAQIKSTPLQNVGDAVLTMRRRYLGFLLAAGYFLFVGFSYLILTAVGGAFQGIVLVPTLILGGGFLAMWWYSGGETVIRVEMGDTQLEGVTGGEQQPEALAFLEQLTMLKENVPERQV